MEEKRRMMVNKATKNYGFVVLKGTTSK